MLCDTLGWMNAFNRFILWDYKRASWQYDVMVAIILAFIFLTPSQMFRDQPRPSTVVMLPGERENPSGVFWIEPDLLSSVPEGERSSKAAALLKAKTGRKQNVIRVEQILDSEQEVRGFMAFTTQ